MNVNSTERYSCPCCEKSQKFSGVEVEGYEEVLCEECDYIHYAGGKEVTADDYEKSEKYTDYYSGNPPKLWYHRRALNHLLENCGGGNVLDFGCYDGFFVKAMIDSGLDAWGADWNKSAINAGRTKFGLGEKIAESFTDEKFDTVVALEVIEHFKNPNEFMNIVRELTRENGNLILSCPNKNSIYRPNTDYPPHHFSRFSMDALERIVKKHGYKIISHEREMSFYQMMRNIIGDKLRVSNVSLDKTEILANRSKRYEILRKCANIASSTIVPIMKPIDMMLKAGGMSYLSQIIVAEKNS